MARYVDAEKIRLFKGFFEKVDNVPKFYDWLETLPTADVRENVHGMWIIDEDGNLECSVCGHHGVGDLYCERCGAEMEANNGEIH